MDQMDQGKRKVQGQSQMLLNLVASGSVVSVPQPGGAMLFKPGKIQLEGSVSEVMQVLGLRDRKDVYRLIEEKRIHAWKKNDGAENGKWTILMDSVYALKRDWMGQQDRRI